MKTADIRAAVIAKRPHARYMNLSDECGPCHCIDDALIDRYLSYACKSRHRAWYEALKEIMLPSKPEQNKEAR